jgi:hypothetical protein
MRRTFLKPSLAFGVIGLVALTVWLALWPFESAAPPSLPQPNGYTDLLKAGQMLSAEPSTPDDLSTNDLRSIVDRNADALQLARTGLHRECRVPLGYSMNYVSGHLADLGLFKRLARAFIAEGNLAQRENRNSQAAASYLDAIRLGQQCSRGGVIIDMLVGVACQALGCQAMQGVLNQLQAPDCRAAIRQLEEMDSKAESATDVVNQEHRWSRRTFGWRGQVARLATWRALRQTEQQTTAKLQAQQRRERRLLRVHAKITSALEAA